MADSSQPNTIVREFPRRKSFEATPSHPFHFSVGAIPIRENRNGETEVLVHYFEKTPPYPVTSEHPMSFSRVYKLMTETPNFVTAKKDKKISETASQTVLRGMREEFGMTGIVDQEKKWTEEINRPWFFPKEKIARYVKKRTDYYLVRNVAYVGGRDFNSPEGQSDLEWVPLEELINKMIDQAKRYPDIPDADESMPLIRLLVEIQTEKAIQETEKAFWGRVRATLD